MEYSYLTNNALRYSIILFIERCFIECCMKLLIVTVVKFLFCLNRLNPMFATKPIHFTPLFLSVFPTLN